jgi:hypothetical protein
MRYHRDRPLYRTGMVRPRPGGLQLPERDGTPPVPHEVHTSISHHLKCSSF